MNTREQRAEQIMALGPVKLVRRIVELEKVALAVMEVWPTVVWLGEEAGRHSMDQEKWWALEAAMGNAGLFTLTDVMAQNARAGIEIDKPVEPEAK